VFRTSILPAMAAHFYRFLAHKFSSGLEFCKKLTGYYISASIGLAIYPDDATTLEGLLKCADKAMYAAKSKGRNRYDRYSKPAA
ncbi:MAG: diguanylate cyclase, partial [Gallionella sp.]|nr:diguanylate cyclase [Gallionella sp.]